MAGRFGDGSFAGYTAETPDLYLQERWALDEQDWFHEPVAGSLGVYICAGEIVSAEFYDDSEPRLPARTWWQRLKYVFPWVRLPGYTFEHGNQVATASSDPHDGRNQSVAESAESSESTRAP